MSKLRRTVARNTQTHTYSVTRTHAHTQWGMLVYSQSGTITQGGDQHSFKHSSRGTVLPETSRSFLLFTVLVEAAAAEPWRRVQERWRLLVNFLHHTLEAPPKEKWGGCCWGKGEWIYGSLDSFFVCESTKNTLCGLL